MQQRAQEGLWHRAILERDVPIEGSMTTRRSDTRHVLEYCLHCAAHVPVLRAWGERWCVDCRRPIVPVAEVLPSFEPAALARPSA